MKKWNHQQPSKRGTIHQCSNSHRTLTSEKRTALYKGRGLPLYKERGLPLYKGRGLPLYKERGLPLYKGRGLPLYKGRGLPNGCPKCSLFVASYLIQIPWNKQVQRAWCTMQVDSKVTSILAISCQGDEATVHSGLRGLCTSS